MAPLPQTIPVTDLSAGPHTITFNDTNQPVTNAFVLINRNAAGANPSLNALTSADTLTVDIQFSVDGGVTFVDCGTDTINGGTVTVKGVTLTQTGFGVGIGHPFPVPCRFRVNLNASTAMTISGSITYN